jgi:hypothetical protein
MGAFSVVSRNESQLSEDQDADSDASAARQVERGRSWWFGH